MAKAPGFDPGDLSSILNVPVISILISIPAILIYWGLQEFIFKFPEFNIKLLIYFYIFSSLIWYITISLDRIKKKEEELKIRFSDKLNFLLDFYNYSDSTFKNRGIKIILTSNYCITKCKFSNFNFISKYRINNNIKKEGTINHYIDGGASLFLKDYKINFSKYPILKP